MLRTDKRTVGAYVLFAFWPFMALVYAMYNFRFSFSRNIVWLFCGFFGYTFVVVGEGADSFMYSKYLKEMHEMNLSFPEFIDYLFSADANTRGDYVEPILRYFVSIFTDDFRILSGLFGLFFGYFYSRNIFFYLDRVNSKFSKTFLLFFFLFILIVPIWSINGFRYWTATHVFFWGLSNCLIRRKYKYFFFILLSILVHVAYVLPCVILLVSIIIGSRKTPYIALLLFTFFFLSLDLATFLNALPTFSGLAAERVGGYTHPAVIETALNGISATNWYVRLHTDVIKYLAFSIAIYLIVFNEKV